MYLSMRCSHGLPLLLFNIHLLLGGPGGCQVDFLLLLLLLLLLLALLVARQLSQGRCGPETAGQCVGEGRWGVCARPEVAGFLKRKDIEMLDVYFYISWYSISSLMFSYG